MFKRVIKVLVLVLAFVIVAVLYIGLQHARDIAVEGSIHGSFYPVASALDKYCEDHEEAPEDLQELVPKYLKTIPENNYVSDVQYITNIGDSKWLLRLTSNSTGELRYYIIHDKLDAPPAELEGRVIKQYHSRWHVMEPK